MISRLKAFFRGNHGRARFAFSGFRHELLQITKGQALYLSIEKGSRKNQMFIKYSAAKVTCLEFNNRLLVLPRGNNQ